MVNESITLSVDGSIATLLLNRPEKRNAFNEAMLEEFEATVRQVEARDDLSVLIIRGAGGSFSAGADVSAPPPPDPNKPRGPRVDGLRDRMNLLREVRRWGLLRDLPQAVIAAVEGHCIGIATQLCIMCDLVIVAEDARIGWPALPLGGGFISPMWTWLVGPSRAKYMSFRVGSSLTGAEAASWGWATLAAPKEQFEATVQRVAQEIARTPLDILAAKKASINRQMDLMGFAVGVELGADIDALLHESNAVREVRAVIREHGLRGAIERYRQQR